MNHIYRIVWNATLGVWQAVGEIGKGLGKSKSHARRNRMKQAGLAIAVFMSAGQVYAAVLPQGAQVTAGSANISTNGNTLNVVQSSDKTAINWQSFNIGKDGTVNFQQPNSGSVALNRVVGNEQSVIEGALKANGQIFLLNSNGVLFTKDAQVNTGGIVASTLDLSDADFMAGKTQFSANGSKASIINLGTITAKDGGYVALLGNQVKNEGVITAKLGSAVMAAGDKVSLNFNGNSLVGVTVDQGTLNALVANKNAVIADGGLVVLTAKGLDEVMRTVVNNTGEVRAQTIQEKDGKIFLLGGMENDQIEVGGKLDASAPNGGDGGFIETSAKKVKLDDKLQVTTKADNGKTGTFLIDPNDYTIAASGGDITGSALSTQLASNNVQIQSTSGATNGNGDIKVNDNVTWTSGRTLTLTAQRNININATLDASGGSGGKVVLQYGQSAVAANNTATYDFGLTSSGFTGKINLKAGQNFDTKLGSNGTTVNWEVVTLLGGEADATNGAQSSGSYTLQGLADANNLLGNYVLGANINASTTSNWNGNSGWTPIGSSSAKFLGKFDGLGHTVDHLFVDNSSQGIGFFGKTDDQRDSNGDPIHNTLIRNIGITNANINPSASTNRVGVLVGELAFSTVKNAYTSGSITGNDRVGGLVGYAHDSDISGSYATGAVTGIYSVGGLVGYALDSTIDTSYHTTGTVTGLDDNGFKGDAIGGLVGYAGYVGTNSGTTTITNSYSTGTVTGDSYNIGGLIGTSLNVTNISSSYATGSVSGVYYVGGLIGYSNNSNISDTYATGSVTASGDAQTQWAKAGGLIGYMNEGTTSQSYATGNVSTSSSYDIVGGFIGYNLKGEITKSYATGTVNGGYSIGGFAGTNEYGLIENVYATGNATGTYYVGGLVGDNGNGSYNNNTYASIIRNSYAYNTVTATGTGSSTTVGGITSLNSGTITNSYYDKTVNTATMVDSSAGKTTAEMSDILTYRGSNPNSPAWNIAAADVSNPYPILRWTTTGLTGTSVWVMPYKKQVSETVFDFNTLFTNNSATASNGSTLALSGGQLTATFSASPVTLTQAQTNAGYITDDFVAINVAKIANTSGDMTLAQGFTWNGYNLTLSSQGNITINSTISATGTHDKLTLEYGQGAVAANNTATYDFGLTSSGFAGKINLQAGQNFDTKLGNDGTVKNWTVITALGSAGDEGSNVANSLQSLANSANLSGNFVLGGDINAAGTSAWNNNEGWTPIGAMPDNGTPSTDTFKGSFDGLGHTISGLTSASNTIDTGAGLFGGTYQATISNIKMASPAITSLSVHQNRNEAIGGLIGNASDSKISNIIVSDATLSVTTGQARVGGLIGQSSNDTIDHIYVNNITINSSDYGVGGLIGDVESSHISSASVSGTITSTITDTADVGGLFGYSWEITLTSSSSSATITASGDNVGGLIGEADSSSGRNTISSSSATGSVGGRYYVGGLVGYATHTDVSDSHTTGAVTGSQEQIGGLVGYAEYTNVSGSYATGAVSSTGSGNEVGGLIGYNTNGTVDNSYATGDVSSSGQWGAGYKIGGLIGYGDHSIVTNSYATGNVTGGERTGGLVGRNENSSTITNSYATGDVTATGRYAGGLVGYNYGSSTISQSHATGAVTSTDIYGGVGGLIGKNYDSDVTDSYAEGDVSGVTEIGGLIGAVNYSSARSTITDSYATGDVTATGRYAGGLIGNDDRTNIEQSFASGNVQGNEYVAGLVGNHNGWGGNGGLINKSYATGTVTAVGTGAGRFGGLVGENRGHIRDSFATGAVDLSNYTTVNVSSPYYATGGLVGYNSDYNGATITSSYAANTVTSTATTDIGGLVGASDTAGAGVTNSYFDKTINTGMPDEAGYGKTTAEMKKIGIYSGASPAWNIIIDPSLLDTYPQLRWATTGLTGGGSTVWVIGKTAITYSVTGGNRTFGQSFTLPTPIYTGGTPTGTSTVKVYNGNTDVTAQAIAGTLAIGTYTVKTELTDNEYGIASAGNTTGTLTISAPYSPPPPPPPTVAPTQAPTVAPTEPPTVAPTVAPTEAPTVAPTEPPTIAPTPAPTLPPEEKQVVENVIANVQATVASASSSITSTPITLTAPTTISTGGSGNSGNTSTFHNVVNIPVQLAGSFSDGTPLAVISSPNADEPTQTVTLSQAQQMLGGGTSKPSSQDGNDSDGNEKEVRVPVSRNSLAEIVNGGVKLPSGVEQQLFVVKGN